MHWVMFVNDAATTEIYTLSLHDALPISGGAAALDSAGRAGAAGAGAAALAGRSEEHTSELQSQSKLVCRLRLEKKNVQDRWSRLLSTGVEASVLSVC